MYLFLDQASRKTGWAHFSSEMILLNYGVIDLSDKEIDQVNKRYKLIHLVNNLVEKYNIKQIALEGIYKNNVQVFKILAKVQGSLEDYCCTKNIVCFSFDNSGEWRKYIGIKAKDRKTYKAETKKYIIEKYGLPDNLSEDEYDAVAQGDAYFVMLELKGIE
jgi:Holliday junction resolvasome RuvABC endonuclease subunit